MPTQQNIQQTILNGSYSLMQLVNKNLTLVMSGSEAVRQGFIQWFRLNLQALQDQYSISDYTSVTTVTIYDRINQFVGIPYGATVDPNFQIPGQTTITVPVVLGFNSGKIPFSTTNGNPVFVLNYSGYAQLYGDDPSLQVYTYQGGIEQEDEQTAPVKTRVSGPGTPLVSITLYYVIGTSGYILISGVVPASAGGTPGGGSGAITFNFTNANLLQDSNGSWYLPLTLSSGLIPFVTLSNGVQVTTQFDDTFSPNRLYGFANNNTQIILVKVI